MLVHVNDPLLVGQYGNKGILVIEKCNTIFTGLKTAHCFENNKK